MITKQQAHILPLVLGLLLTLAFTFPAHAIIFEDFLFNDVAGTTIDAAVNDANPGNLLDSDPDTVDVVTNGLGQLNASLKNNTAFGSNYVDTVAITTGKVYGVMELTWDFQSVLDPAENEEIRISMINADPRSTFITSQLLITRTDADELTISGTALGTGAEAIDPVVLNGGSLTQSSKFIAVLAADLDLDTYELLYSANGGSSFLSTATKPIDPARGVESMRMVLNNDFVGDNVLVDRFYLTDTNPVPSVDDLTLEVNTVSGEIKIKNETTTPFDINSYRIESPDPDSDLNFSLWNSFSDQNLDPVDGVDPDSTVGNGIGETWDEAAGSDNDVLAESFLQGSSLFGATREETLGLAFQPGGAETLTFQYRDAATGALSDGTVKYIAPAGVNGDYNGNGIVDDADYAVWLAHLGENVALPNENPAAATPGVVDAEDLAYWKSRFGAVSGSGAISAVPEPASWILLIGLLLTAGSYRKGQ